MYKSSSFIGLEITALKPCLQNLLESESTSSPVRAIIIVEGIFYCSINYLITFVADMPSITGICISIKIRSKLEFLTFSTAYYPL